MVPATVSDVVIEDESVSFSVDRIGTPVLVRVSYFPNWKASGAQGPYRVAPNMMVVVPTSTEVKLTFEPSSVDRLAYVMTISGFIVLGFLWRSNRRKKQQFKGVIESASDEVENGTLVSGERPES